MAVVGDIGLVKAALAYVQAREAVFIHAYALQAAVNLHGQYGHVRPGGKALPAQAAQLLRSRGGQLRAPSDAAEAAQLFALADDEAGHRALLGQLV